MVWTSYVSIFSLLITLEKHTHTQVQAHNSISGHCATCVCVCGLSFGVCCGNTLLIALMPSVGSMLTSCTSCCSSPVLLSFSFQANQALFSFPRSLKKKKSVSQLSHEQSPLSAINIISGIKWRKWRSSWILCKTNPVNAYYEIMKARPVMLGGITDIRTN